MPVCIRGLPITFILRPMNRNSKALWTTSRVICMATWTSTSGCGCSASFLSTKRVSVFGFRCGSGRVIALQLRSWPLNPPKSPCADTFCGPSERASRLSVSLGLEGVGWGRHPTRCPMGPCNQQQPNHHKHTLQCTACSSCQRPSSTNELVLRALVSPIQTIVASFSEHLVNCQSKKHRTMSKFILKRNGSAPGDVVWHASATQPHASACMGTCEQRTAVQQRVESSQGL